MNGSSEGDPKKVAALVVPFFVQFLSEFLDHNSLETSSKVKTAGTPTGGINSKPDSDVD